MLPWPALGVVCSGVLLQRPGPRASRLQSRAPPPTWRPGEPAGGGGRGSRDRNPLSINPACPFSENTCAGIWAQQPLHRQPCASPWIPGGAGRESHLPCACRQAFERQAETLLGFPGRRPSKSLAALQGLGSHPCWAKAEPAFKAVSGLACLAAPPGAVHSSVGTGRDFCVLAGPAYPVAFRHLAVVPRAGQRNSSHCKQRCLTLSPVIGQQCEGSGLVRCNWYHLHVLPG